MKELEFLMTKRVAFSIQKGGSGKTTSAISVGSNLVSRGNRVLLIDVDPQGNATTGLGLKPNQLEVTVYECMLRVRNGWDCRQAVIKTKEGIDLIAANRRLSGAAQAFANTEVREHLLREVVEQLTPFYDYVLIDTPPEMGFLILNALVAADSVIVPLQAQFYPLDAINQLEATIKIAKHPMLNPKLELGGVFLTMVDNTSLAQQVKDSATEYFKDKMFNVSIPRNVALAEAPAAGQSILTYAPKSTGAKAYQELTEEFLTRYA